jgi:hypothetical protein
MTENKELSESDMTIQELYKIMIEDDSSLISNLNNDSFFNEISIILDYSSNPKDKVRNINYQGTNNCYSNQLNL